MFVQLNRSTSHFPSRSSVITVHRCCVLPMAFLHPAVTPFLLLPSLLLLLLLIHAFQESSKKKKKIKHLTSHLFHVFLRVSCSRQRAAGGGAGGEREHAEPGEERHGPAAQRHATGSLQLDPLSAGLQRRHARPRRRWREAAGSRR